MYCKIELWLYSALYYIVLIGMVRSIVRQDIVELLLKMVLSQSDPLFFQWSNIGSRFLPLEMMICPAKVVSDTPVIYCTLWYYKDVLLFFSYELQFNLNANFCLYGENIKLPLLSNPKILIKKSLQISVKVSII